MQKLIIWATFFTFLIVSIFFEAIYAENAQKISSANFYTNMPFHEYIQMILVCFIVAPISQ